VEVLAMDGYETPWKGWPVAWSGLWVGALAALAAVMIFGLIGFAIGAHEVSRTVSWKSVRFMTVVFNIGGAFFAFVIGGWAATRVAGIVRAETAVLHGALVWLLTIPMLLALAAAGVGWHLGGWYGALASPLAGASAEELAASARNGALATVAVLLTGLMGGVIGGWMGSGEPMRLTARRLGIAAERPRRIA
jgi:hypothetical protein